MKRQLWLNKYVFQPQLAKFWLVASISLMQPGKQILLYTFKTKVEQSFLPDIQLTPALSVSFPTVA